MELFMFWFFLFRRFAPDLVYVFALNESDRMGFTFSGLRSLATTIQTAGYEESEAV